MSTDDKETKVKKARQAKFKEWPRVLNLLAQTAAHAAKEEHIGFWLQPYGSSRDVPSLPDRPLAITKSTRRTAVSTASYYSDHNNTRFVTSSLQLYYLLDVVPARCMRLRRLAISQKRRHRK